MKKSEQTYKIEFNHKEMKNIEFLNVADILSDEHCKLTLKYHNSKTKFSKKRIGHCISAISLLMYNFDRLEKEFRNEVKEVV